MDDKMYQAKKPAPLLPLAVTVVKNKKADAPSFEAQAVRLVSVWALFTAALFLGYVASASVLLNHYDVCPPSSMTTNTNPELTGAAATEEWTIASAYAHYFRRVLALQPSWMIEPKLTAAAAAEEWAIGHAVAWCSAAEAAAAALALLLPERLRRSRRALAYAALAATVANHIMFTRVLTLFLTADPGRVFFWIVGIADVVLIAEGDMDCLLALLGKGAYANAKPAS